jgi:hypothetical protein
MFRKLCLLLLVPLLALSGTSCSEDAGLILLPVVYPFAVVGMPIQSAIEGSIRDRQRWNSYPPPYREFIIARGEMGWQNRQEEFWDSYRRFVELLKQHSLTRQDYENGTAENLLKQLQSSSSQTLYHWSFGKRTFQDDEPFIEGILDDAEFFLDNPGPNDLNTMIASAILSGLTGGSNLARQGAVPVRGDQRLRLAELLVRVVDKFITIDTTDWAVWTLAYARRIAPSANQRAEIDAKLHPYLRGCLRQEIPCDVFTLELTLNTFLETAADEDEKMNIFRQASATEQEAFWRWRKINLNLDYVPVIMKLLNAFSRPEDKMEVLERMFYLSNIWDSRVAFTRAIPYYFLVTTKDQRWGEMVPALMKRNEKISPTIYKAEIAMLQGDIATGLQLWAEYTMGNVWVWDDYAACAIHNASSPSEDKVKEDTLECFRQRGQHEDMFMISIPYISGEGKQVEFLWDKPVTYYSGSQAAGWRRQSGLSPDQIVMEFYWNAKGCVLSRSRERQPSRQERNCINQVVQAMIKGQ